MNEAVDLYLDLVKKCLVNWVYGATETWELAGYKFWKRWIINIFKSKGLSLVKSVPMNPVIREDGRDWPPTAHTMVGFKRLNNIQFCVEDALAKNIPGDFMECGVWRGGSAIFMRAILKAHGIKDRIVYVADSFEGCPKSNIEKYPQDKCLELDLYKELAVPLDQVRANFACYGLLDEQVSFIKGWFKDTLPNVNVKRLAVLRLDGDLYESTMDVLTNLYEKLSIGGYLIVDDFGAIPACKEAVLDYRKANGINDEIVGIDWAGAYWQKVK